MAIVGRSKGAAFGGRTRMASKMLGGGTTTMDYIEPAEDVQNMVETAVTKAGLSIPDFLIRGFLSGALLGFSTTLAFTATKQTNLPIVGAIIFPVGFVLIILLGLELVTGNFALLPLAYQAKRISAGQLLATCSFSCSCSLSIPGISPKAFVAGFVHVLQQRLAFD
jgi:hypothetical protein